MSPTKYIVIQIGNDEGMEMAFTFPAIINHDHFFHTVKQIPLLKDCDVVVVGAGFYNRDQEVTGESISLGVKSRERDALIIRKGSV